MAASFATADKVTKEDIESRAAMFKMLKSRHEDQRHIIGAFELLCQASWWDRLADCGSRQCVNLLSFICFLCSAFDFFFLLPQCGDFAMTVVEDIVEVVEYRISFSVAWDLRTYVVQEFPVFVLDARGVPK